MSPCRARVRRLSSAAVVLLLQVLASLSPALALASGEPGGAEALRPGKTALPSGPGSVRGLDESMSVGAFTGQVTHTVAIPLPPGRGGFGPSLSLTYDGSLGNGGAGVGWTLGTPLIRRSTRDGQPSFTDADELELVVFGGGGRLVQVAPYRYVVEGKGRSLRVEQSGNAFVATDATGAVWRFEEAWPAEPGEGTRGLAQAWWLSSVRAPSLEDGGPAEEIAYDYQTIGDEGALYLAAIRWGPETECGGRAFAAELIYEPRPDAVVSWREGFRRVLSRRLSRVDVKSYCGTRESTHFEYDPSPELPLSRLSRVRRTGRGGQGSLAPLSFAYGEPGAPAVLEAQGLEGWRPGARGATLTDIDGDGLEDIARFRFGVREWRRNLGGRFGLARELPGGDLRPLEELRLADLVGDPRPEMAYVVGDTWRVWTLRDGAYEAAGEWPGSDGEALSGRDRVFVDVNGDRRLDLLRATALGVTCRLGSDTGLGPPTRQGPLVEGEAFLEPGDPELRFLDANGDGLADAVWLASRWLKVYLGRGDGTFEAGTKWAYPWTDEGADPARLLLADLNRDGLLDMVRLEVSNVHWWAGLAGDWSRSKAGLDAAPLFSRALSATLRRPAGAPPDSDVSLSDMDGNGSLDVVWSSEAGVWYGDIAGPATAAMLTSVDNGLGKRTTVAYTTSALSALASEAAGQPWTERLPVNMPVPARVTVRVTWGGQGRGAPSAVPDDARERTGLEGDPPRVVEWQVRDGFWDVEERRFGGFLASRERTPAALPAEPDTPDPDAAIADRVEEIEYERGDGMSRVLRGKPWRSLLYHAGATVRVYRESFTVWDALAVEGLPTDEPLARVAAALSERTDVYEGAHGPMVGPPGFLGVPGGAWPAAGGEPISTGVDRWFDAWARPVRERDLGRLDEPGDDRETVRSYAPEVEGAAVLDRACMETLCDGEGRLVASVANSYAGEPSSPSVSCAAGAGPATMAWSWLGNAAVDPDGPGVAAGCMHPTSGGRWLATARTRHDAFGNPAESYAAGRWTRLEWVDGVWPAAETLLPDAGGDPAEAPSLRWEVTGFDKVLGLATEARGPDGLAAGVAYDSLGRPVEIYADRAGDGVIGDDDRALPLTVLEYHWDEADRPWPYTVTRRLEHGGGAPDGISVEVFNGAGEPRHAAVADALDESGAPARWAVSGMRARDSRGRTSAYFRPFQAAGAEPPIEVAVAPGTPASTVFYDALDREVEQRLPAVDPKTGRRVRRAFAYGLATPDEAPAAPGAVIRVAMAADGLAPVTRDLDAWGAVVRTRRTVPGAAYGGGDELETAHARRDAAGRPLEFALQLGTPLHTRHEFLRDTLGRLVAATDPDIGPRELEWDDAGRLVRTFAHTVDGGGDVVTYGYDWAGRLEVAEGRSADDGWRVVRREWVYDTAPPFGPLGGWGCDAGLHAAGRPTGARTLEANSAWHAAAGEWQETVAGVACVDAQGRPFAEDRVVAAPGGAARLLRTLALSPSGLELGRTETAWLGTVAGPEVEVATERGPDGRAVSIEARLGERPWLAVWSLLAADASGAPLEEAYGDGTLQGTARSPGGLPARVRLAAADGLVGPAASCAPAEVAGAEMVGGVWDLAQSASKLDLCLHRNAFGAPEEVEDLGSAPAPFGDRGMSFAYDGAGRLTRAVVAGRVFEYGYDALQNMVRRTAARLDGGPAMFGGDLLLGTRVHGAGGGPRRLERIDGAGASWGFWYDLAGRMVARACLSGTCGGEGVDRRMAYDAFDGLREVTLDGATVVAHYYGPDGERVRTDVAGAPTELRFGSGSVVRGGWHEVLVGPPGGEVARLAVAVAPAPVLGPAPGAPSRPEVLWLHRGVGPGPAMVTDESGAVMDDRAYEPFGVEIMADAGVEPLGGLAKPVEPVTGWSDHGARWMAVELGIWTSPDPPVKGPAERFMEAPWDLNPYGYVRGNPVVYWDPDGKAPVWLCGQGGGCDLVGWTSYGEAQNYAALAPGAKRREYVANAEWEGAQVNISVAELDVDHAEIINNLREQLRDEAADKLFDAVVPFIGGLRSLSRAADKMDDVVRMQKKLVPNGPDGSLVAKVKAALWRYPKVTDARTGRAISFPTGDLKVVAKEARVSWDSHDRAAFIKAWHDRGYEAPRGGWAEYDIHHIHPRELGGTNDFWNLVPVQRETHQKWLNSFWQKFIDP